MDSAVDIAFDCLPLRCVGRVDVPLDASPAYRARCERLKAAIGQYEAVNAYYLYNARCIFRLANSEVDGMLRFEFEGTLVTGPGDRKAERADLVIELGGETCGGVSDAVIDWFRRVVHQAVLIEFDRYIAAGSLAENEAAVGELESIDDLAGFAAMHV